MKAQGHLTGWNSTTLGRAYDNIDTLHANLAQPERSALNRQFRCVLNAIEALDNELGKLVQ